MAKMFYSLEEAAAKLGKSEDDVRQMASRGEITEFRDSDRLIFKVDQIDMLAGDDEPDDHSEMSSMIPLTDTGGGSALGMSGSGLGVDDSGPAPTTSEPDAPVDDSGLGFDLGDSGPLSVEDSAAGAPPAQDPGEQTGISVFDADDVEQADPSAVTQMSDMQGGGMDADMGELNMDSLSSGSGLMDLTQESDDTSLGADLLQGDLYSAETAEGATAVEGGDLFETGATGGVVGDELSVGGDEGGVAPAAVVVAEPYDGGWSGLTGGLTLGAVAALLLAMAALVMSQIGVTLDLFGQVSSNMLIWVGIFAGAGVLFGLIGFVLGKRGD